MTERNAATLATKTRSEDAAQTPAIALAALFLQYTRRIWVACDHAKRTAPNAQFED